MIKNISEETDIIPDQFNYLDVDEESNNEKKENKNEKIIFDKKNLKKILKKNILEENLINSILSQKNIINDHLLKYEEKSNNNYWITYDTNSCRYDAFFFIYCKVIQPFIEPLDKIENLISLNRISTELMNIKD